MWALPQPRRNGGKPVYSSGTREFRREVEELVRRLEQEKAEHRAIQQDYQERLKELEAKLQYVERQLQTYKKFEMDFQDNQSAFDAFPFDEDFVRNVALSLNSSKDSIAHLQELLNRTASDSTSFTQRLQEQSEIIFAHTAEIAELQRKLVLTEHEAAIAKDNEQTSVASLKLVNDHCTILGRHLDLINRAHTDNLVPYIEFMTKSDHKLRQTLTNLLWSLNSHLPKICSMLQVVLDALLREKTDQSDDPMPADLFKPEPVTSAEQLDALMRNLQRAAVAFRDSQPPGKIYKHYRELADTIVAHFEDGLEESKRYVDKPTFMSILNKEQSLSTYINQSFADADVRRQSFDEAVEHFAFNGSLDQLLIPAHPQNFVSWQHGLYDVWVAMSELDSYKHCAHSIRKTYLPPNVDEQPSAKQVSLGSLFYNTEQDWQGRRWNTVVRSIPYMHIPGQSVEYATFYKKSTLSYSHNTTSQDTRIFEVTIARKKYSMFAYADDDIFMPLAIKGLPTTEIVQFELEGVEFVFDAHLNYDAGLCLHETSKLLQANDALIASASTLEKETQLQGISACLAELYTMQLQQSKMTTSPLFRHPQQFVPQRTVGKNLVADFVNLLREDIVKILQGRQSQLLSLPGITYMEDKMKLPITPTPLTSFPQWWRNFDLGDKDLQNFEFHKTQALTTQRCFQRSNDDWSELLLRGYSTLSLEEWLQKKDDRGFTKLIPYIVPTETSNEPIVYDEDDNGFATAVQDSEINNCSLLFLESVNFEEKFAIFQSQANYQNISTPACLELLFEDDGAAEPQFQEAKQFFHDHSIASTGLLHNIQAVAQNGAGTTLTTETANSIRIQKLGKLLQKLCVQHYYWQTVGRESFVSSLTFKPGLPVNDNNFQAQFAGRVKKLMNPTSSVEVKKSIDDMLNLHKHPIASSKEGIAQYVNFDDKFAFYLYATADKRKAIQHTETDYELLLSKFNQVCPGFIAYSPSTTMLQTFFKPMDAFFNKPDWRHDFMSGLKVSDFEVENNRIDLSKSHLWSTLAWQSFCLHPMRVQASSLQLWHDIKAFQTQQTELNASSDFRNFKGSYAPNAAQHQSTSWKALLHIGAEYLSASLKTEREMVVETIVCTVVQGVDEKFWIQTDRGDDLLQCKTAHADVEGTEHLMTSIQKHSTETLYDLRFTPELELVDGQTLPIQVQLAAPVSPHIWLERTCMPTDNESSLNRYVTINTFMDSLVGLETAEVFQEVDKAFQKAKFSKGHSYVDITNDESNQVRRNMYNFWMGKRTIEGTVEMTGGTAQIQFETKDQVEQLLQGRNAKLFEAQEEYSILEINRKTEITVEVVLEPVLNWSISDGNSVTITFDETMDPTFQATFDFATLLSVPKQFANLFNAMCFAIMSPAFRTFYVALVEDDFWDGTEVQAFELFNKEIYKIIYCDQLRSYKGNKLGEIDANQPSEPDGDVIQIQWTSEAPLRVGLYLRVGQDDVGIVSEVQPNEPSAAIPEDLTGVFTTPGPIGSATVTKLVADWATVQTRLDVYDFPSALSDTESSNPLKLLKQDLKNLALPKAS